MAKSAATKDLESYIWQATRKMGTFCCFEVTIGINGKERVDYMTYDTKGVFRCYEVKVTKADFRSPAAHSFVGNFNYYVLTRELYEQVKDEIPDGIGVYVNGTCKRRAKRRTDVDTEMLKDSMIRSLSREAEKIYKSEDENIVSYMRRQIQQRDSEINSMRDELREYRLENMRRRNA